MECDVKLPKETFGRLRMASKASKMLPRHPQDGLLAPQDAPKTTPGRLQNAPRWPDALSRASLLPRSPRMPFGRPRGALGEPPGGPQP